MDGDIAPLPDLVEVAERHGAIMMIDDAHASGVLGPGGKGTVAHFGIDPARVDIQVGTLSKAIGVLGGFIAGPPHLIEWLVNRGRPYLFSTSAPPPVAAACIAALDVIEYEPERIDRLWANTGFLKEGLHALGFDTGDERDADHAGHRRRGRRPRRTCRGCCSRRACLPRPSCSRRCRRASRVRTIVTAEHTAGRPAAGARRVRARRPQARP